MFSLNHCSFFWKDSSWLELPAPCCLKELDSTWGACVHYALQFSCFQMYLLEIMWFFPPLFWRPLLPLGEWNAFEWLDYSPPVLTWVLRVPHTVPNHSVPEKGPSLPFLKDLNDHRQFTTGSSSSIFLLGSSVGSLPIFLEAQDVWVHSTNAPYVQGVMVYGGYPNIDESMNERTMNHWQNAKVTDLASPCWEPWLHRRAQGIVQ